MPSSISFIDGQNLYRSAKTAFGNGVPYPNFCPLKLSRHVANFYGLDLTATYFYTGIPDVNEDPGWHYFWKQKKLNMERDGVRVFTRQLQYVQKEINVGHGGSYSARIANEKGIDVRIAIDMVVAATEKRADRLILFSQDQDLSEATKEICDIGQRLGGFVKPVCAFPRGEKDTRPLRGVYHTEWYRFGWDQYRACIDPRAYPKP